LPAAGGGAGQEQEGAAAGRGEGIKDLLTVDARRGICKMQLGFLFRVFLEERGA